ncbi:MAG: hypothetical protein NZ455_08570 [Bacteroidia bacterium]|nr:hypothetical protein [Bacteroidia bacterium]
MREGHGARALALCETKCSTEAKRSAECTDPSESEGHAQKSKIIYYNQHNLTRYFHAVFLFLPQ